MAYEIYKKKHGREDYFKSWDAEQYNRLDDSIKNQIYDKYLVKCEVFDRDNYKCQNIECKFPDSPLTIHHIKFQKNGGKDSIRNCVTICRTCHKGYHRAKRQIILGNHDSLPAHLRGMTFKVHKATEIDWKKVKAEMKKLRKSMKRDCGLQISWEQLRLLLEFLEIYSGDDD